MILEIVQYGHPALRAKGRRVEKIDDDLLQLAEDMLETMYEADGVGLAAQQVGVPIQLCVIDVADIDDRPSVMRIDGEKVDLEEFMPMVLINPVVETFGSERTGPEGCLSFPGLRGRIERPASVRVTAQDIDGQELRFEADGLLATAVQHEYDHLHGVLFIDKMDPDDRKEIAPDVDALLQRKQPR